MRERPARRRTSKDHWLTVVTGGDDGGLGSEGQNEVWE